MNQTVQPDEVRCYTELTINDFPINIQNLIKKCNLTLHNAKKEDKGYKKLIEAVRDFWNREDIIIITIDDDWKYRPTLIEELLNVHNTYPNAVICERGRKMIKNKKYQDWPSNKGTINKPYETMIYSGSGCLFRPNMFKESFFDMERMICSPTADDLWWTIQCIISDVPILTLTLKKHNLKEKIIIPNDVKLYKINRTQNIIQFNKLVNYAKNKYNIDIWEKINYVMINKYKIGVFGTCRIDNYNILDFVQTRKKYPYTYKNNKYDINVRPLGYTTTSSDILQNLKLIQNDKYKEIKNKFIINNTLKKRGDIFIPEINYDYLILEICSIKKIIHIPSKYIIPYEIDGKHNKNDFIIETETFDETIQNIIEIKKLINCKIILLPPIIEFNGKCIQGKHENTIPDKVLDYRIDIINRLKKASIEKDITLFDWNLLIKEKGYKTMLLDQFHFTNYAKKYISNKIINIIESNKI
jgi:hypothetical protein